MQSCSSALCIVILLTTTSIAGSVSADPTVKVKLHDSATLSCSERCSGLVRWTVFHKPTDVLAECDQTSCRSVKEGYQMIYDQYLKGDLSLIITDADFSKRARYISDCDGEDLCDVQLRIEPLKTPLKMEPGESLELKVDIPDPVDVFHNGTDTAGQSSGQICTVDGRSLQCKPEYKQRASLRAALELRGATPSDSGVYTVMDQWNEEVIHIYTVTVRGAGSEAQDQIDKPRSHRSPASDCRPCVYTDQGAALPGWVVPVLVVLLIACAVFMGIIIWQLRKKPEGSKDANNVQNGVKKEKRDGQGAEEQESLVPGNNDQKV